jgi:hypothetical protein
MEESNNIVNFNSIIDVKTKKIINKMKGGTNETVSVTIIYQKTLSKEYGLSEIDNQDLYLVTDKMDGYKMERIVIPDVYSVTIRNIPIDRFFRFKFLRGTYLEVLEEDAVLKSLNTVQPAIINNGCNAGDPLNGFEDYNKWNARWRWIFPTSKDVNRIYFFTYYVPNFSDAFACPDRNNFFISENNGLGNKEGLMKSMYSIKDNNNKITIKNIDGNVVDTIELVEKEITDNANVETSKKNILKNNLGTNIEPIGVINDAYLHYVKRGVRNENFISYFSKSIEHNINIVKTQLVFLESEIKKLNDDQFFRAVNDEYNLILNNDQNKVAYAMCNQLAYKFVDNGVHVYEYKIFFGGLRIDFKCNINLESREFISIIDNILSSFEKLSTVSVNCFTFLPITFTEYLEFKLNYKSQSKKFAEQLLFLYCLIYQKLIECEINGSSINIGTATVSGGQTIHKLNDTKITLDSINGIVVDCITDSIVYQQKGTYITTLNFIPNFLLLNDKVKQYFANITQRHLLTMNWVTKNLLGLVYQKSSNQIDYNGNKYDVYSYNAIENGVMLHPKKSIEDNTNGDEKLVHTFFNGLMDFYKNYDDTIANNLGTVDLTGNNFTLKKVATDIAKNVSMINKLFGTISEPDPGLAVVEDQITTETITKIISKKLKNGSIYLTKVDAINETYAMFGRELKLFSHSFWLNLNDISINIFIQYLTEINRAKLFYKFACIYALLGSEIIKSYGMSLNAGKFELDGKEINTPIVNRSSIEYYNLINHNDTLNKLFKIARTNLVTGTITLNLKDEILKNETLDLTQYFIQNVSILPAISKDIFTDGKFGTFSGQKINGIGIINAVSILLQLVDEEQRGVAGVGKAPHENFKKQVNRMHDDLKHHISVINMISTFDLRY